MRKLNTESDSAKAGLQDFLLIGEAAKEFGVSEQTLRRWSRFGRIKCLRNPANGYRLFRREDIQAWLEELLRMVADD